ncbi:MAG: hypothetical protein ACRDHV_01230 [Actinomycetota bacterium]
MDELEGLFEHAREVGGSLPPVAARAFRETLAPALDAMRRGAEPFHAAAVALDGQAVLICGGPAAGKSTLVGRLLLDRPSARYVADDAAAITPVPGGAAVHPATGPLRVTPELGRALLTRFGGTVRPTTRGRMAWAVPETIRAPGPTTVSSVLILDEDVSGPTPLTGSRAARRIMAHLYVPGFAGPERHRRIIHLVTLLAGSEVVAIPREDASAAIPGITA